MTPVQGPDREERLNHMVLTYEKDLLRLCVAYLRDVNLAQDAVQETFLKAYRRMHRFEGRSSEKTWLMRIAINTWDVICQGHIYPKKKELTSGFASGFIKGVFTYFPNLILGWLHAFLTNPTVSPMLSYWRRTFSLQLKEKPELSIITKKKHNALLAIDRYINRKETQQKWYRRHIH